MSQTDTDTLALALAEPFPPDRLGWKPQATSKDGNKALAICYVDARDVQDRLDEAVGIANWQDRYTVLPDGNVMCELSLRINGEWVSKSDVGGESDQKDAGDRGKAAFSDALKRAAVKWGVARYIYRLEGVWTDYDPQRKQIVGTPKLPAWALPKRNGNSAPAKQQPADKLSIEQERELVNLLEKTGTPASVLLDAYKVANLAELPYVHYGDALSGLKRKAAAQAKVASLVKQKGLRWVDVEKDMQGRWGKGKVEELDGKQLKLLVEMLETWGDTKE